MIKLIILIVGAYLVAKFWFGVDLAALIKKPAEAPIIKEAPVSLFNLKRYTDNSLQIAINHPLNWTVAPFGNELVIASTQEGINSENRKDQIRVAIKRILLTEGQTLEGYINSTQVEGVKITSRENVKLDNKPAIKVLRERDPPVEPPSQIIYVLHNGSVYALSATPADSELIPVFRQMLDSFEFLE